MSHLFNDDYERLVGQLITENSTDIVQNKTKEKASVVYKCMINASKESVCIYLNEFDPQLLNNEAREALILAVNRGVGVHIVIQDELKLIEEQKFFDYPLNQVVTYGSQASGSRDFCVVDRKMFHVNSTKNDTSKKRDYEALYSVNHPNVCDKLLECYWRIAPLYPLHAFQNSKLILNDSDFKWLFYAELEQKMPQIKTRMDYMQCLTNIIANKSRELSAEKYQKLRQEVKRYLCEIQSRPNATPEELFQELGVLKLPPDTMNLYKLIQQNQHQHIKS